MDSLLGASSQDNTLFLISFTFLQKERVETSSHARDQEALEVNKHIYERFMINTDKDYKNHGCSMIQLWDHTRTFCNNCTSTKKIELVMEVPECSNSDNPPHSEVRKVKESSLQPERWERVRALWSHSSLSKSLSNNESKLQWLRSIESRIAMGVIAWP